MIEYHSPIFDVEIYLEPVFTLAMRFTFWLLVTCFDLRFHYSPAKEGNKDEDDVYQ